MDKESLKLIETFVNQRLEKVKEQHKKELVSLTRKFDEETRKLQKANASNAQKVQRLEKIVSQQSREIQHLEQQISQVQGKVRPWGGK